MHCLQKYIYLTHVNFYIFSFQVVIGMKTLETLCFQFLEAFYG